MFILNFLETAMGVNCGAQIDSDTEYTNAVLRYTFLTLFKVHICTMFNPFPYSKNSVIEAKKYGHKNLFIYSFILMS